MLSLEHVAIAIEPARWVLLGYAVAEEGFAATAAAAIARDAGLDLKVKNARNHAETLEEWKLLERLEEKPVFFVPTDEGRHLYSCLLAVRGQIPPAARGATRLVALVAEASRSDFELLIANPAQGRDLGEELRLRVRDASWARRGAVRIAPRR